MNEHQKSLLAMRHQLIGANMHRASKALEMVLKYHTGFRKDNITPSHMHPLRVAQLGMTIRPLLTHQEESVCVFLLHDIPEDHGIAPEDLTADFGSLVSSGVKALTKKFRGARIPDEEYFRVIADHPIASIGKGLDRVSNFNDMQGVFTPEKQLSYIAEAEQHILPMLRRARKNFPEQYWAYENIKLHLRSQIALVKAMHQGQEKVE